MKDKEASIDVVRQDPKCCPGGKLVMDEMANPRQVPIFARHFIDFACDLYTLLKRKCSTGLLSEWS
jgi:hypothetical protein